MTNRHKQWHQQCLEAGKAELDLAPSTALGGPPVPLVSKPLDTNTQYNNVFKLFTPLHLIGASILKN